MKNGGNEAAEKYFLLSREGRQAYESKDPKTKYGSSTAAKYKDLLKDRVNKDVAA